MSYTPVAARLLLVRAVEKCSFVLQPRATIMLSTRGLRQLGSRFLVYAAMHPKAPPQTLLACTRMSVPAAVSILFVDIQSA
jgi:hypothetical protein